MAKLVDARDLKSRYAIEFIASAVQTMAAFTAETYRTKADLQNRTGLSPRSGGAV